MTPDLKCRGISFADRLVPRVLDGSKTVTRRPIKRLLGIGPVTEVQRNQLGGWICVDSEHLRNYLSDLRMIARNPYGRPGVDTLYGREACRLEELYDGLDGVRYRVDEAFVPIPDTPVGASLWVQSGGGTGGAPLPRRWRPPHLMPRWASRMPLALVSVRPELLSEITAEEVVAEGFAHGDVNRFLAGWDALYAKRPEYQSSADPAVWRIEFHLLETAPWTT